MRVVTYVHTRGSRALRLAALAAVLGAAYPSVTTAQRQDPAARAIPATSVVLVVRDAATGLPLDAAQLSRLAWGAEQRTIGRSGTDGRIDLPAGAMVAAGATADDPSLLVQRIGYAPRYIAAPELLSMIASAGGGTIELRLAPRPALLSTISVQAEARSELAAGTALAIATADRAAISERPATSLAASLDAVEGVTTSHVGAWGSKVSLRGLGGERLAFMVDGSRVNRACTFGMDQGLATMDPGSVERVEMLAGPGSTLYGSGNVGGVINVVTRNPALELASGELGGELRVGASSAIPGGTAGVGVWTRRGRAALALQADGQSYGDYRTPVATVQGSSFRAANVDLKAGYDLTTAQRLAVQLTNYSGRDIGWPSMSGGSIPREDRRTAAVDWGWQRGRGALDAVSARAYVQRLDHHMLVDMVMPMSGGMGSGAGSAAMRSTTDARSYSTTSGARAQLRLRPTTRSHVDAGVEGVEWKAEGTRWVTTSRTGDMAPGGMGGTSSTTTYHAWPNVRILDLGLFAQGEHQIGDRATFSAGARADRITKRAEGWSPADQTVATGNLGARTALGAGFGLRTSAGLGYRVPDPTELFGTAARPDGYVYRGNPELRTEKGRTIEAGLTWNGAAHAIHLHDAEVSVTAFRNDLSGLISPAIVTGDSMAGRPIREYVNIDEARITGLTSSVVLDMAPAFRLRGTGTYARGEDLLARTPLAAVAPLTGTVALRFAPDAFAGVLPAMADRRGWVEVEGRAAARQSRVSTSAGERITPGWGVLAIRAGADVAGTSISVSVDNLLDRSFREHLDPAGLLRPGRNLSVRATRGF